MTDTDLLEQITDLEFVAAFTVAHARHTQGARAEAPPAELILITELSTDDTHVFGHPETRHPVVSCRTTDTTHTHWRHPAPPTTSPHEDNPS